MKPNKPLINSAQPAKPGSIRTQLLPKSEATCSQTFQLSPIRSELPIKESSNLPFRLLRFSPGEEKKTCEKLKKISEEICNNTTETSKCDGSSILLPLRFWCDKCKIEVVSRVRPKFSVSMYDLFRWERICCRPCVANENDHEFVYICSRCFAVLRMSNIIYNN